MTRSTAVLPEMCQNHSLGFQKAKPHRMKELLVSKFGICKSSADAVAMMLGIASCHPPASVGGT